MTLRNLVRILVVLLAATALASCGSGKLEIKDAWARSAPAGGNSAVYFVIDNGLAEDDAVVSASCDKAMMAELHISKLDANGNMMMEHQERVPVAANSKVEFKPGGLHVMLMNLKEDLAADQKLAVTLTFEKAGTVQVEATVRQP